MLCDIQDPVLSATRIRARIVLFNLEIPMTRGFTVSFLGLCLKRYSCPNTSESRHEKICLGFQAGMTNCAVQPLKMARGLKFLI